MERVSSGDDRGRERPAEGSDPRWDLVQRTAASASLRKSRRLRDLLLFVCERALADPGNALREQEIGTAVFGRPADFDTSHDTLVRVHASQLRKRLQQHFTSDGASEPIIIEIPKGTYVPVFREREPRPEPPTNGRASAVAAPVARPRATTVLASVVVVLLGCCAWLGIEAWGLRQRLAMIVEPRPSVDRLWTQIFGNGLQTYIALADCNLTVFEDLIHLQLTPVQYQRQQFRQLAEERLHDPVSLDIAMRLMNRQFTTMVDTTLARRIGLLNAAHGVPTDVVLARDLSPRHFKGHNAILSGPRRANPWLELFEERLNFRSRFDEEARLASFENHAPLPDEEASYVVKWERIGYCRVAYLPNLDATGSVMILSGTDMASTEAGVEFITSERWVRDLYVRLGAASGQALPHFELLLRTRLVVGAAPGFEVVALRTMN
jgi:hypothetical protein